MDDKFLASAVAKMKSEALTPAPPAQTNTNPIATQKMDVKGGAAAAAAAASAAAPGSAGAQWCMLFCASENLK